MKRFQIISSLLSFLSSNRNNSERKNFTNEQSKEMMDSDLILKVKLAINPKFQDWVLFKNGTYIVFDNADIISDLESEALQLMKEFGPVYAGGSAGDFGTANLGKNKGWVISGHGYGMYTYVAPSEIPEKTNDVEIGLFGRNKRDMDSQNPIVIHVNRKTT
ncbi:hypothetical protein [Flavobacterium panacagri]|uniref:hypothetical protein n=1 Tax=Flavobacterium panacagri TaxID=3034146 RepID=UPI0025A622BC|nr:hypothetical protein [Flavobacterium panacagri]